MIIAAALRQGGDSTGNAGWGNKTMDDQRLVHLSRFLSKHLRHQPELLGISLDPGGWVAVDHLLTASAQHHMPFTRAELEEVVARNSKQRFSFDESGTQIRANQGHSVPVDLGLEPMRPPAVLYHGTGHSTAAIIRREGLRKMRRQHVHLSLDSATARIVGARHGRPVVFVVDAAAMHRQGFVFYRSANGVWLADQVPPAYLQPLDGDGATSDSDTAPPPAFHPGKESSEEA